VWIIASDPSLAVVMSSESSSDVQIIETGDSIKVKQVLDECVNEAVKNSGYNINYTIENIKILLMILCCIAASIAQFYPLPFPKNLTLLGVCVGA
jgi:hypothetical protein